MSANLLSTNVHTTREGWLAAAIRLLDDEFFKPSAYVIPEKLQVSCGFPKYATGKAIGQCWDCQVSTDGTTHMFISPVLDSAIEVLQVELHEMIHASVGVKEGHKGAFRKLAKEFGMAGKMTATYAEPEGELWNRLAKVAAVLGPYPHAAMKPMKRPGKPTNGWVRYQSITEPKYTIMISPKSLEEWGAPTDPWGDEMVAKGEAGDD